MSNECRCTNPDGGGTKCPDQHVAICIRGRDRECYGSCVKIPGYYSNTSGEFNRWLQVNIEGEVVVYAIQNYSREMEIFRLEISSQSELRDGGKITFQIGDVRIYVKFSFQFRNDSEPLGGTFEVSMR